MHTLGDIGRKNRISANVSLSCMELAKRTFFWLKQANTINRHTKINKHKSGKIAATFFKIYFVCILFCCTLAFQFWSDEGPY